MTKRRDAPQVFLVAVADGGQAQRVDVGARLISFTYEDEEEKADRCLLELNNYDLVVFDDPAFKQGMLYDVTWGYPGNMAPPRRCVVTNVGGGIVAKVTLVAQSILMNKVPKARVFQRVRYSDVARTIAREQGFDDDLVDVEDTPIVHETVTQARMTDAQLLRKLAHVEGFEFYVDHDGFHFHRRRVDQAPQKELVYFVDQSGQIITFSTKNDLNRKRGRHRARGHNLLENREIDVDASAETDDDGVSLAPVTGVPAPSGRRTIMTFDRDTSASHLDVEVENVDDRMCSMEVTPTAAQTADDAHREAAGRNRRARQAAIELNVSVVGDPGIVAKTVQKLTGIGARLSGAYYVRRVVTKIVKSSGYSQELEVISDGHHGHARRSRLAGDLELPGRQAQAAGRVNDQGTADEGALTPVITFDRDTSAAQLEYRNSSSGPTSSSTPELLYTPSR